MPEPEFLSIDLSTQSLTYLVSPTNFTNSISLPQIQNGSGGGQYPVEEWIKAIEEMLMQLQARKEGTRGIVAIGGCAQVRLYVIVLMRIDLRVATWVDISFPEIIRIIAKSRCY